MKQCIFLIDGSALFYRSFYAISPLHNSKGEPTQAILGFLRSLQKIIKNNPNAGLIIAWDAGSLARKKLFPDYKSNREKVPEELKYQKNILLNILDKIEIQQITIKDNEADDIIFSLNNILKKDPQNKIIITTADKDLFQLIDEKTEVLDPFKEKIYKIEDVYNKFEFKPEKILFYFSLLGDASDNIPGVEGIGKVSATKIVKEFLNLEDLYNNLNKINETKIREKLLKGKENAFLSQSLFQLKIIDHLQPPELEKSLIKNLKWSNAYHLFEELELKSLLPKSSKIVLESKDELTLNQPNITVEIILNEKDLQNLFDKITKTKIVSIDLETTGLNWQTQEIVGFSFAVDKDNIFYLPIKQHLETNAKKTPNLEIKNFDQDLLKILANPEIVKIFHNAKFDLHFLHQKINHFPVNNFFDTAIAARLLFPEWIKVGLKSLSQSLLGVQREDLSSIFKKFGPSFEHLPLNIAANYAGLDAKQTIEIFEICKTMLNDNPKTKQIFTEIETPLIQILEQMEKTGILIDTHQVEHIKTNLEKELEVINGKIQAFLEANFPEQIDINLNSPKQLQNFLFNILNLKTSKKTSGKNFSTDVEVLTELAKVHMIPALILEYRKLTKIKNTYLDSLLENQNKETGAIHSDFSQIVTATGRLASNNPNLQNIPNKWKNINVRSCFVAREEKFFLSADYSQIELRVLAELCQDPNLINIFSTGGDIHAQSAIEIFNKTINEISQEERSIAKRINFSILYGLSAFSLAKEMNISNKDAKKYIENFFTAYPKVKPWMDRSLDFAKKNGFVETFFGRKRWFKNLNDNNQIIAKAEARAAINAIIQGTAADLIKIAMITIDKFLKEKNYKAEIILQVHDEILFEINKNLLTNEEFILGIQNSMEKIVSWCIPLIANLKTGENWGSLTKL